MPLSLLFRLGARNLMRHRRRNLLMIFAIAGAVAGTTLGNSIIRGMQQSIMDRAIDNLTGHIQIQAPGYQDDPNISHSFTTEVDWQLYLRPETLLGFAPRIRVPAVILSERETRGIELVGIDPAHENISFFGDVAVAGERLIAADDRRIVIGAELARQLQTDIGRRLVIMTQGMDGKNREAGFRIAGIFDSDLEALEKSLVFTGLEALQALLDAPVLTEISLRFAPDTPLSPIQTTLSAALLNLNVSTWRQLEPQADLMFSIIDTVIYVFFAIFMGALAFGLMNALITAVMERIRELGMLRAVGMRPGAVIIQVVIESMLLMLAGIVVGLLLGSLFVYLLKDGIDLSAVADSTELIGIDRQLVPVFLISDLVRLTWLSLVLGFIASLYPAWRAVRLQPLEALGR